MNSSNSVNSKKLLRGSRWFIQAQRILQDRWPETWQISVARQEKELADRREAYRKFQQLSQKPVVQK
jgi:hypothetical protein